ncbi:hypothetical protein Glove_65g73 [Diversispora epigaea]|uniref:Uncharacterized protein n=1 Tax=Diversispora epigaea TaxID=1348612 RepID=A0A397JHR0_9GLOM|nr:hypothetical protein Glove_65g73 [Diversispora epigaea]
MSGADRDLAKEWREEHKPNGPSIHLHQPKFISCENNNRNMSEDMSGTTNSGAFIVGSPKRDQKKDSIDIFFQDPSDQRSTKFIEKLQESEIISDDDNKICDELFMAIDCQLMYPFLG